MTATTADGKTSTNRLANILGKEAEAETETAIEEGGIAGTATTEVEETAPNPRTAIARSSSPKATRIARRCLATRSSTERRIRKLAEPGSKLGKQDRLRRDSSRVSTRTSMPMTKRSCGL